MTASDADLRRAVDEVLEPAWATERRRATRRLVASCAGRWAGGMVAATGLALVLGAATGAALPPAFFVVVGLLAAIGAMPDAEERSHLSRRPRPPRRLYLLPRR